MNSTYSIQKPCTEDWGKMSQEQQGRHCQVCCKTVVDFSKKSNTEIIDFLQTNSEKKICGRFRSAQLVSPAAFREPKKGPRYRIFFAALFFVFGGMLFNSCTSQKKPVPHLMGDVAYVPDSTEMAMKDDSIPKIRVDTMQRPVKPTRNCILPNPKVETEIPAYKMGKVAFDPADTIR